MKRYHGTNFVKVYSCRSCIHSRVIRSDDKIIEDEIYCKKLKQQKMLDYGIRCELFTKDPRIRRPV